MRNQFRTSFYPDFCCHITADGQKRIKGIRGCDNEDFISFKDITDLIKHGRHIYYVVYNDCRRHIHGYDNTQYSMLIRAKSKEEVRRRILRGKRIAHGNGEGRSIGCIIELEKMDLYEAAEMFNSGVRNHEQKIDERLYLEKHLKQRDL